MALDKVTEVGAFNRTRPDTSEISCARKASPGERGPRPMSDIEKETCFYPLKTDDPHYAAIGRLTSAWSYFEFHINQLIWHLSAVDDERGACVTSHIFSWNSRAKALLALIDLEYAILKKDIANPDEKSPDNLPRLNAALKKLFDKKAEPLSRKRNRAVHDTWMYGKVTGIVAQITATAERRLDYGFRQAKITDVDKWWKETQRLDEEFQILSAEIRSAICSLRQQARSSH